MSTKHPSTYFAFNNLEKEEIKLYCLFYKHAFSLKVYRIPDIAKKLNISCQLLSNWTSNSTQKPILINDVTTKVQFKLNPEKHLSLNNLRILTIDIRKQLDDLVTGKKELQSDIAHRVKNLYSYFNKLQGRYELELYEYDQLNELDDNHNDKENNNHNHQVNHHNNNKDHQRQKERKQKQTNNKTNKNKKHLTEDESPCDFVTNLVECLISSKRHLAIVERGQQILRWYGIHFDCGGVYNTKPQTLIDAKYKILDDNNNNNNNNNNKQYISCTYTLPFGKRTILQQTQSFSPGKAQQARVICTAKIVCGIFNELFGVNMNEMKFRFVTEGRNDVKYNCMTLGCSNHNYIKLHFPPYEIKSVDHESGKGKKKIRREMAKGVLHPICNAIHEYFIRRKRHYEIFNSFNDDSNRRDDTQRRDDRKRKKQGQEKENLHNNTLYEPSVKKRRLNKANDTNSDTSSDTVCTVKRE